LELDAVANLQAWAIIMEQKKINGRPRNVALFHSRDSSAKAGHDEICYLKQVKDILKMPLDEFRIIGDRNWSSYLTGESIFLVIKRESPDTFVLFNGNRDVASDSPGEWRLEPWKAAKPDPKVRLKIELVEN
jgi:hypothetical protein